MRSVLLYISYNVSAYESYIFVAVDKECRLRFIRIPDELEDLYEGLRELEIDSADTEWCIAVDIMAPQRDHEEELRSHGFTLSHSMKADKAAVRNMIIECFSVDPEDIEILFPHESKVSIPNKVNNDDPPAASEDPDSNTLIISGAAKIVEEKYKKKRG